MHDVVTRFAPSPTGHLHVGGARTALFCWALARRMGGKFLLRIEDTDQVRTSVGACEGIFSSLTWLGLDWDEGPEYETRSWVKGPAGRQPRVVGGDPRGVGPFFQSQRLELYNAVIDEMIERDLAYPAFESFEELDAKRKACEARKESYRYDRAALEIPRAERLARMRAGEGHVIRFMMPAEAVVVRDEVLGEVRLEADQLDDLVLRKRDGFPTYHFACVVDDEKMGVTHVLRGQEHLINSPRHVAMQRALGYRTPVYAHLPLISNPDGSKMSKRDKDKAAKDALARAQLDDAALAALCEKINISPGDLSAWIADKRAQLPLEQVDALAREIGVRLPEINVGDFFASGYLPEVLCNYLALLGWNPGMKNADGTDLERFDLAFLAEHFSLERLGRKASRFDREKLLAFNADTIQKGMDDGEFLSAWRDWAPRGMPDNDLFDALAGARGPALAAAARPRTKTLRDAIEHVRFALLADDAVEFDLKAVEKVLRKGEPSGVDILRDVRAVLEGVEPFEASAIEDAIKSWSETRGLGMGKAAQPLRVAITGGTVSPGLGETLALVGRAGVLARLDRCVEMFSPSSAS